MIKAVIFDMFETLITQFETPLYFGDQMADEAEIRRSDFLAMWRPTGDDRTTGKLTLEEVLTDILIEYDCYTDELLDRLVNGRIETKRDCFRHLHPGILPMLEGLKSRGVKIGLISNCFSEEVGVIKESVLWPFFDAPCLSFELGVMKPSPEIFAVCAEKLGAKPEECLYVGDGGSRELYAARDYGMTALQAMWYIKGREERQSTRDENFPALNQPEDVFARL
ncbi:MAG: HAD-IA family hydrolase [Clostridia bacterium]|nr:HAD-IA family hydrolase [Clostridia bacterium]